MKHRRVLLILVAAFLLPLGGLGIYWSIPPKPGVTLENFRRLYNGMSQEEVESALGPPSRKYRHEAGYQLQWEGKDGAVYLNFFDNKKRVRSLPYDYFAAQGSFYTDVDSNGSLLNTVDLRPDPADTLTLLRRRVKEWTGW